MEMFNQIAIMIFGSSAIWLIGRKEKWNRWGYILGMCGQPFWIYTTFINQQWGLFFMSVFYTYSWGQGIYNYWIKNQRISTMKQGYKIDINGNKTIIPDGCKEVYCHYNNLTELILPKACERVYCHYNNLTELILPESCKEVYCYNNNLTELILPDSCKYVSCDLYLADTYFDQWLSNNTKIYLQ